MNKQSEHSKRVEEFMRLAGQAIPNEPFYPLPSPEDRVLRAKLILEEALETIEAMGLIMTTHPRKEDEERPTSWEATLHQMNFVAVGEPDLEKVLDGCADIRVVTTGTLLAFGFREDEALQEEVDKANLRKFEPPKCETCGKDMRLEDRTVEDYTTAAGLKNEQAWFCTDPHGNSTHPSKPKHAGPYRREDGKHIKPPYWTEPDIKQFLP